jgi:multidrug efflux system membrane fusion protein
MDDTLNQENPAPRGPQRHGIPSLLRRAWVWLLLAALIGGGAWLYLGKSGQAKPAAERQGSAGGMARTLPVVAATARRGDINVFLNGLGTVTPLNTVTVRSRVDGELTRVLFREGQLVKQGDLLAEIDPRPYKVQLAQAEGQMARDTALLRNAQADLERYRALFEQDSIARQQLDTQASLVRQYEGALTSDQAQIDNAKLQLAYARITAPIAGRLGLRLVDAGNIVRSGDTNGLVVITQLQPVSVVFTLPEDNVPAIMKRLQAGEQLAVDAFDRAGKTKLASGSLLTVDNQIDPATGSVKLKAQFGNEDYSLFANQFVNARMLLDVKRDAVLIPATAVQRGTQGSFVYVVKSDNSVTVRPVKPGITEGEVVAIDEGLAAGEMVVVDGTDKLREGAKVEIAQREPASAAPGGSGDTPRAGERRRREAKASAGTGEAPPPN